MADNKSLKDLYNKAYSGGKRYSGASGSFFTFSTADVTEFVVKNINFQGNDVLEIGCGTGDTAVAIARSGALSVTAIDYSEEAIKTCQTRHAESGVTFELMGYKDIRSDFDVIVMQEVIEHVDDPESAIVNLVGHLRERGQLVVTCPNFTNVRGYVWMTLQLLFDVPMSLSDLHFFSPFDMQEIAERHGFDLDWTTFAHDRVNGEMLITDLRKRLTNALRDARMNNTNVEKLMAWLAKVTRFDSEPTRVNGAKGFYVFSRSP